MSQNVLSLANKVASTKQQLNDVPKAVLISKGSVLVTNRVNTIKFDGFDPSLNCMVASDDFLNSWSATSEHRQVTQDENSLHIVDGKTKIDLSLDKRDYPLDIDHHPQGTSIPPGNFMETVKLLVPFLKFKDARAYMLPGFAYVSDGHFLIRIPNSTEFPQDQNFPVTITLEFAELLAGVERTPQEVLVSEDNVSVIFDGGYVESVRYNNPMDVDYEELFLSATRDMKVLDPEETDKQKQDIYKLNVQPMDEQVFAGLKAMVKISGKDDRINFSPMGINLMQGQKLSYAISHEGFPFLSIDAKALKTILAISNEFNFDNSNGVVFRGAKLEGFWAIIGSQKVDESTQNTAIDELEALFA